MKKNKNATYDAPFPSPDVLAVKPLTFACVLCLSVTGEAVAPRKSEVKSTMDFMLSTVELYESNGFRRDLIER